MMLNYIFSFILCYHLACFATDPVPDISVPAPKKVSKVDFAVIVPTYNNEKVAKRNLKSIVKQKTSASFHVYIVNDKSTDKTGEIVEAYKAKHKEYADKITIIHNAENVGALANIYNTIYEYCKDPEQVAVVIDGDDWCTPNHTTLERLRQEYEDPDLWVTYGNFVYYPDGTPGFCQEIPREVFEQRKIREHLFYCQHPRTCRVGLFKKIKKEDLLHEGKFFPMTGDMAVMFPLLEMCAPKDKSSKLHAKFIPDILYVYNNRNPLSDLRKDRPFQYYLETVIRAKQPYEPLDNYLS